MHSQDSGLILLVEILLSHNKRLLNKIGILHMQRYIQNLVSYKSDGERYSVQKTID